MHVGFDLKYEDVEDTMRAQPVIAIVLCIFVDKDIRPFAVSLR